MLRIRSKPRLLLTACMYKVTLVILLAMADINVVQNIISINTEYFSIFYTFFVIYLYEQVSLEGLGVGLN